MTIRLLCQCRDIGVGIIVEGVKTRYERFDWSADRGSATQDRLVDRGLLTDSVVKLGKTRTVALGLRDMSLEQLKEVIDAARDQARVKIAELRAAFG